MSIFTPQDVIAYIKKTALTPDTTTLLYEVKPGYYKEVKEKDTLRHHLSELKKDQELKTKILNLVGKIKQKNLFVKQQQYENAVGAKDEEEKIEKELHEMLVKKFLDAK